MPPSSSTPSPLLTCHHHASLGAAHRHRPLSCPSYTPTPIGPEPGTGAPTVPHPAAHQQQSDILNLRSHTPTNTATPQGPVCKTRSRRGGPHASGQESGRFEICRDRNRKIWDRSRKLRAAHRGPVGSALCTRTQSNTK